MLEVGPSMVSMRMAGPVWLGTKVLPSVGPAADAAEIALLGMWYSIGQWEEGTVRWGCCVDVGYSIAAVGQTKAVAFAPRAMHFVLRFEIPLCCDA